MKVWLVAVILAAILVPSGIYGSHYFAGAQQASQATSQTQPTISVNPANATAGGTIQVNGNNFTKDSTVSLSFDKVLSSAPLTGGSAIILQGDIKPGTTTASATTQNGSKAGLSGIFGFFQGLFGANNSSGAVQGSIAITQGTQNVFLAVQTAPASATNATLKCAGKAVSQVAIPDSGAAIAQANLTSGTTYSDCAIDLATASGIQPAQLNAFTVPASNNSSSPDTVTVSNGTFNATIKVPSTASGNYSAVAAGTQDVAFSHVTVSGAGASSVPTPPLSTNSTAPAGNSTSQPSNATASSNSTASSNASSSIANATAANQNMTGQFTFSNQTAGSSSSGQANVNVGNTNVQQGAPLAISGQGFKPQTPVQVFINNVQVTNIITNVQGSFNSVVIVPTTVNTGSANVVVKAEQTTINKQVVIVKPTAESLGPSAVTFAAVSTGGETLTGAPVSVFDTSTGQLVMSGKTPLQLTLRQGTYSVFYSAFNGMEFVSASPGAWAKTGDVGAGVVTVPGGSSMTVTATYQHTTIVAPPISTTTNSLKLKAVDTSGNPINGMFVTVYSADNGARIQQGFTNMTVSNLKPGTYPIFFANFGSATFASAYPGTWVQTPYGGAGLVTIPNDGVSHDITVTAVYQVSQTTTASFAIQAPINVNGTIFSITSNQTTPAGPYINSGLFRLKVDSENPAKAAFSASFVSARSDLNSNVALNSQQSRAHATFQIDNLKQSFARPVGPASYVIVGTADVLMDGTMLSAAAPVQITLNGGPDMAPTGIQITFQGDGSHSAAARFETLYGAVDIGLR